MSCFWTPDRARYIKPLLFAATLSGKGVLAGGVQQLGPDESKALYHYFEHLGVKPVQENRAERSIEVKRFVCMRSHHSGYELEGELSFFECRLAFVNQFGEEILIDSHHPRSSQVFWILSGRESPARPGRLSSGIHSDHFSITKALCFEATHEGEELQKSQGLPGALPPLGPRKTYSCFISR